MGERAFDWTAGIVFLLIAIGHVARVIFRVPFVVYDIQIPMWASLVAAIVMGVLAYEGFHLARKSQPHL